MLNPQNPNELYFPVIIPTPVLGGKRHTWKRDVNGGATMIADLCIAQNGFFGGNVVTLGLITEYGMYACLHKDAQEVVGFYIHDPEKLTELGRKLVIEAFPKKTVIFEVYREKPLTAEQIKDIQAVKQYYKDHGMSPSLVDTSNAQELKALYEAMASGKAEKPFATMAQPIIEPMLKEDVVHEHDGSMISSKILANKVQPKRRSSYT